MLDAEPPRRRIPRHPASTAPITRMRRSAERYSADARWPPSPACSLNHNKRFLGIPRRSIRTPKCSNRLQSNDFRGAELSRRRVGPRAQASKKPGGAGAQLGGAVGAEGRGVGDRALDGVGEALGAVGAQDLAAQPQRAPSSSARPAIGVWQEPSRPAGRRARRRAGGRSRHRGSAASSAATPASAPPLLDAMAPWATAAASRRARSALARPSSPSR